MSRESAIAAFLARHGYAEARAEPLAQDASFRRYLRLRGGPRPAVLMDAPPPEDVRPFLRIAGHLAGIGLSVPEILAADEGAGLLLEEDLGDDLLSSLLSSPPGSPPASPPSPPSSWPGLTRPSVPHRANEDGRDKPGHDALFALFDAAVDTLVAMQRASPPSNLPAWDAPAMASTALANLFDWWWPATFGCPAPAAARENFAAALDATLAPVAAGPSCFVHRDFFAGNLLWLPERQGIRRIGVLDFQGAAVGHPAYDLVSLLQDARRDIPTAIAERAIAHYLSHRPELDPAEFRAAYAACAAQRHLRVACQWVRLALRDGRPGYLVHGPRTWRLLDEAVQQPAAAPLAAALGRWIPPARRRNPPELAA